MCTEPLAQVYGILLLPNNLPGAKSARNFWFSFFALTTFPFDKRKRFSLHRYLFCLFSAFCCNILGLGCLGLFHISFYGLKSLRNISLTQSSLWYPGHISPAAVYFPLSPSPWNTKAPISVLDLKIYKRRKTIPLLLFSHCDQEKRRLLTQKKKDVKQFAIL